MLDQNNYLYFNRARVALKYGIIHLGLKEGDEILVPDFICDSIFQSIIQTSLSFKTYSLEDNLEPNWLELKGLISAKSKAILMVHYFGQPQDVKRFINFAKTNKLFLIEDNAHGHEGYLGKQVLGSFGDIGISSPRKFLDISEGGKLYFKENKIPLRDLTLPYTKKEASPSVFRRFVNRFPVIKNQVRLLVKKRPNYEDPFEFKEPFVDDLFISDDLIDEIESLNWKKISYARRAKYLYLRDLTISKGLEPVFSEIHRQSNPWCFAAYTENLEQRKYWYDWGWKNNISVFSWPTLRDDQINDKDKAYMRWKKLICFSTSN